MQLAILYAILAAISMSSNFCSQRLVDYLYDGPYAFLIALIVGTGVGLITKYVLDKRYIFRFRAENVVHDAHTFFLYSFMGVFTTVIFWGFEAGFKFLFQTDALRYAGGAIGLTIGYVVKYHLDKKFVFRKK
ncbi:MAG: GtrA family protein [Spongiibacteraceae bacterium]